MIHNYALEFRRWNNAWIWNRSYVWDNVFFHKLYLITVETNFFLHMNNFLSYFICQQYNLIIRIFFELLNFRNQRRIVFANFPLLRVYYLLHALPKLIDVTLTFINDILHIVDFFQYFHNKSLPFIAFVFIKLINFRS